MGVISEAKAAVDLAKELGSYLKQAGEHDPKLMGMFEDLRGKVLSLYESDIELRQQVRELEEKLKLREEVFFDQDIGAYFKGTPENRKDGPFCAKCYTEKKELVPMRKCEKYIRSYGKTTAHVNDVLCLYWLCPVCNYALKRE